MKDLIYFLLYLMISLLVGIFFMSFAVYLGLTSELRNPTEHAYYYFEIFKFVSSWIIGLFVILAEIAIIGDIYEKYN